MEVEETVWYLEMLNRRDLVVKQRDDSSFEVRQARIPCPALNAFFYAAVGKPWQWTDRLRWSEEEWRRHVEDPLVETWIGYCDGTPAGYAELKISSEEGVEISSFGLIPQFVGAGLGGRFLGDVVELAWRKDCKRIWLHTCSYDHPHALANYQARGFRIFDERKRMKYFPDDSPPRGLD